MPLVPTEVQSNDDHRNAGPGRGSHPLTWSDIQLFLRAVPLAARAGRIRRRPLSEVSSHLLRRRGLPRSTEPAAAAQAAARACARVARWLGGIDTCLTRSLVAGALLSDRDGVVLHVGFRRAAGISAPVDGHAWLTVDGRTIPTAEAADAHVEPYVETLTLTMRRPGDPA
jgi:hypothetical protein